MKVALVGDFSARLDEGLKNIAKYTAAALQPDHEVHLADLAGVATPSFWQRLRRFRPEVLHYIPGNTLHGLALAATIRRAVRAPVVFTVCNPRDSRALQGAPPGPLPRRVLEACRPDLALVQSQDLLREATALGWRALLFPNGVDTERFSPVGAAVRAEARADWGVSPQDRMLLHVGHLIPRRNLEALLPLARAGHQVHVVASTYQGVDEGLKARLLAGGVHVHVGFVEDLPRLYGAADAYVFPVRRFDTILMPLSVLEALSCDRPVVTVPHDGLRTFLPPGGGLAYAEPRDFPEAVQQALAEPTRTRAKVARSSWKSLAADLARHYRTAQEAQVHASG